MKTPIQIPQPDLSHARKLSPLELNALKYVDRHTVLTPALLKV